jgi:hypothetical protein
MQGGTIGGIGPAKNTAANGGGVMVSGGASFVMTAGSITGNTATSSGGGVDISAATFTMIAGSITGNTAVNGGGVGIITSSAALFEMQGGSIAGNNATSNGGGVHISGSGSRFEMQGGTIGGSETGEKNTVGSNGGGVYVANGVFAMSGAASIIDNGVHVLGAITMEGGARVVNEWVYLATGTVITLKGAMTGTAPVAVIYPEVSTSGTKVLDGAPPLISNNKGKFNVDIAGSSSPPPYSGSTLNNDGTLP